MKTRPKLRKTVKVIKTKGVTVWAAVNPKTGEIMLPTVRWWQSGAAIERDLFYHRCLIYQCWLSPLFLDEVKNKRKVGRV